MTTAVQSPGVLRSWRFPGRSLPASGVALADPIRDPLNLFLAAGASILIICGMVSLRNDMVDWYLFPVFLCGALIGPDMFAWLRGQVDTFDPLGILGAYGYFFFFLAPLLTVMWNYHTRELPEPPDWLSWIGWASTILMAKSGEGRGISAAVAIAAALTIVTQTPTNVWNRPRFGIIPPQFSARARQRSQRLRCW